VTARLRTCLAIVLAGCGGKSDNATDATGGHDGAGGDSPGVPTDISVTVTNHPNDAAMFGYVAAYADGDGAWQLAPTPNGDIYTFAITSSTYRFAYTCDAPLASGSDSRIVTLAHFATAARPSLTLALPNRCTDRLAATVQLSGTISNQPGAGSLEVLWGDRSLTVGSNGKYSAMVQPATRDLFVAHIVAVTGAVDPTIDFIASARAVTVSDATVQNIDFSTAQPLATFAVTANGSVGKVSTETDLATANGTNAALVQSGMAPLSTGSLPAAEMQSDDVYNQIVTETSSGQAMITSNATAMPGAITYSAPPPLGGALASVTATMPYPIISTSWGSYANAIGYTWTAAQMLSGAACGNNEAACTITWTSLDGVTASAGMYEMPDLSALPGWTSAFELAPGTLVTGTVQAITSSAGATDYPPGNPVVGTQRTFARSAWSVTP